MRGWWEGILDGINRICRIGIRGKWKQENRGFIMKDIRRLNIGLDV